MIVLVAGRVDRREDFAVIRWQSHRQKVIVTVAHDIEGNTHTDRERLGLGAGLLFGQMPARYQ
jgi:hypothetical protein